MKSIIYIIILCALNSCESKQPTERNRMFIYMDSNVNYVQRLFTENKWTYPLYVDTTDTMAVLYNEKYIIHNRYASVLNAFKALVPAIDSTRKGFWVQSERVYKEANVIYFVLAVQEYKTNIEREYSSEGWGYIDSNKIMVAGNRALFRYENERFYFVKWLN